MAANARLTIREPLNRRSHFEMGCIQRFHCGGRRTAATAPNGSKSTATWGPESPMEIGSGGSRMLLRRKATSHLSARLRIHQANDGTHTKAATEHFKGMDGTRAKTEAQTAMPTGTQ